MIKENQPLYPAEIRCSAVEFRTLSGFLDNRINGHPLERSLMYNCKVSRCFICLASSMQPLQPYWSNLSQNEYEVMQINTKQCSSSHQNMKGKTSEGISFFTGINMFSPEKETGKSLTVSIACLISNNTTDGEQWKNPRHSRCVEELGELPAH